MAATTSASSCSTFFNLRSKPVGQRKKATTSRDVSQRGCGGKLDGVGIWVVNGFATAFFASLERLSCIRITTHEDEGEDANDVPLIQQTDGNHVVRNDSGGGASRRRKQRKGVKKESGLFLD